MDTSFFDRLAPWYREYAHRRRVYLDAVDRLVVEGLRGGSLLDVGSGDGSRILRLAQQAGLRHVTMCEPSAAMRSVCREAGATPGVDLAVDLLDIGAEHLGRLSARFENVTCLWNVLGHLDSREARVRALVNMAARLEPGGLLQFDVNNRYNVRAYGWRTVVRNMIRDGRHPGGADGVRPLDIVVRGHRITGRGYLFSAREMESMVADAGLRIADRIVVDYETGRVRRTQYGGQLFYRVVRA